MDALDKVFTAPRDAGLKRNASKCSFGVYRVTYLGHIISKHGIEVDPDKAQAVRAFHVPLNSTQVRAFHSLFNYFRRFIPNFGETAKALTNLCKKDAKLRWTDIQQLAFDHLKNFLCVAPVLAYPAFNARFFLATNASVTSLGAVIYQLSDCHPRPIAYISHASSDAELNWRIPEKELYALIYSLEKFKPYLYGPQFTWITDAMCLTWLDRVKDTIPKLLRWCL
jgi:RNase H-like domain found in reverse transcriptase